MGRLGVADESRVVLYDTSISAWAARVWWMLRWVGFDRAAVLDGGIGAWRAAGLPISDEKFAGPAGTLTPRPRPDLIADRDEVLAATDDPAVTIVDTLGADHFRGESAMYARPGHIPNAINVPCFELLDESRRLVATESVADRHGGDPDQRMITYCGGGIAASLNAFALSRAGFADVAVYTASLQEWAADPSLPLVTG
jgi:thiosulfate/3-mercaptopyruvate sulfurtransferase